MSSADVLAVLGGEEPNPETDGSKVGKATAYELLRIDATLWPQIRELIEGNIRNAPRERQEAIGPSELDTNCLQLPGGETGGLAAQTRHRMATVHRHLRPRALRVHVRRIEPAGLRPGYKAQAV